MHEIKCPHCGQTFTVDETEYAGIAQQVRDAEFQRDLDARLELLHQASVTEAELARVKAAQDLQRQASEKDAEIEKLKAQVNAAADSQKVAVLESVGNVEKQRDELKAELQRAALEKELAEKSLIDKYEVQIKDRDDEIERLHDFKLRQSTKMVGESLEQHCEIEFNKVRAGMFPTAYFEKDNDARTGSKGDFIFRQDNGDGVEIVSIMFEMKNENDETATKKKNEDFLKELDKDRNEKGCEYAVLVSLLEPDNDLYNTGIVDVSHRYPKMYVIRPQFFIPMITLLLNASKNAAVYKAELAAVKAQSVDVTNFETELGIVKTAVRRNYDLASGHFAKVIAAIDKAIADLQKARSELDGTDNNLRLASDKVQDVTIRKLTKNSPMLAARFRELAAAPSEPTDD